MKLLLKVITAFIPLLSFSYERYTNFLANADVVSSRLLKKGTVTPINGEKNAEPF